ncbi:MAG: DUF305 domain-containing protein [Thermoleophilaceae bacterium]
MRTRLALALLAALALAAGVAACGGGSGAAQPSPEQGFLRSMVPHHTSAVQMAELAATEARTPFVRTLAAEIRASQEREIAQMRQIHQRLFGTALEPDMGGHMALGLSAEQAGMDHMDGEMMIRGKRPFDRAFVDEMVPHHRGATRMAEAVLARTRDSELRTLAQEIISAQKREIGEMNAFREREYGGPVPMAAGASPGHAGL